MLEQQYPMHRTDSPWALIEAPRKDKRPFLLNGRIPKRAQSCQLRGHRSAGQSHQFYKQDKCLGINTLWLFINYQNEDKLV
jgi:hypothetical protein